MGVKWLSCTFSYKFIWQQLVPMLSPTFSSSGNFLSGEEGEKLGEICILDNVNMILEALSNCRC